MTGAKKSIQFRLVNLISLSLAVILLILFILIDVNMDDWAEEQFTGEIKSQSYILKSIISVNHPEKILIEGNDILTHDQISQIYYQVWMNGKVVEKSPNLRHDPSLNLSRPDIPLNTSQLSDIELPNGDKGVAVFSRFTLPEKNQTDYYLTVYNSESRLNRVLYTIDAALIISFLLTLFLTRILAKNIVIKGLAPLSALNDEIIKTTDTPFHLLSFSDHDVEEIAPIYQSINRYIAHNSDLIQNEKRITSDIAHELKTPIAELITLTEVYNKFPDDPRISENYTQDVLKISYDMKKLVNGLLSLQQIESQTGIKNEETDLKKMILHVIDKQNTPEIILNLKMTYPQSIYTDKTSLFIILRNLIENALYYKVKGTKATVNIKTYCRHLYISISNTNNHYYDKETLNNLTKPLFKFDTSRKNDTHYGLGLTMVKRLCEKNGYALHICQEPDFTFTVVLKIPHHPV